jgi:hypothetical protein
MRIWGRFLLVSALLVPAPAPAHAAGTWSAAVGGPPGRFGAQMAYDAGTGLTVLFSGCAKYVASDVVVRFKPRQTTVVEEHADEVVVPGHGWCRQSDFRNDTWVWNGATQAWTQLTFTGATPHPRFYGSLAYDYRSRSVILFGGKYQTSGTDVPDPADADLCFQDEEKARPLVDQVIGDYPHDMQRVGEGPPIRAIESVKRQATGTEFRYYCFKDTWRLVRTGTTWSWVRVPTATAPSSRFGAGMAYDGLGRPTLVGGCHKLGMLGTHSTEPWRPAYWGCAEYAQIEARFANDCPAGVYHEVCGSVDVVNSDTWRLTWSGDPDAGGTATWTQVGCLTPNHYTRPPCAPPVHDGAAVTFDPASKRVFFFGGYWYEPITRYGGYSGDTWLFDGTTWTRALREGKQDQWCPSINPFTAWAVATPVRVDGVWQVLHQGGKGRYYTAKGSCADPASEPNRSMDLAVWDDTWAWRDTSPACGSSGGDRMCWFELVRDGAPGPSYYATAAYDHVNGKVVRFGGLDTLTTLTGTADTWVYSAGAAPDPCGAACG